MPRGHHSHPRSSVRTLTSLAATKRVPPPKRTRGVGPPGVHERRQQPHHRARPHARVRAEATTPPSRQTACASAASGVGVGPRSAEKKGGRANNSALAAGTATALAPSGAGAGSARGRAGALTNRPSSGDECRARPPRRAADSRPSCWPSWPSPPRAEPSVPALRGAAPDASPGPGRAPSPAG